MTYTGMRTTRARYVAALDLDGECWALDRPDYSASVIHRFRARANTARYRRTSHRHRNVAWTRGREMENAHLATINSVFTRTGGLS